MRRPSQLFFCVTVCGLGSVLLPAHASAENLVIVRDGRPNATIVVSSEPGDKIKLAAEELGTYVAKISGATLPVVTDSESPTGPLILVGKSRLTDAVGVRIPSGLTPARREEGFVIYSKGDRLVLAGNDEGPYHGTEYAVYDFLRQLGVRWFMPGEFGEVVPKQKTLVVPEQEIHEEPDFLMRNWWLHTTNELRPLETQWKLRNKMNPDPMFATPGDSSVRNVVAPKELLEEKPDLFALNENGTRNPHLPNLTNPEAVRIAAEKIKAHFRANPEANSYGFAPDDGLPRDFNPETVALNQGFVTLGGRPGVAQEASTTREWLMFVNAVTKEVRKEFPHVYIATNGYANRNIPPQGLELDDHLVIMFAAIWSCTLHGYDDAHCWQKVRQGQMLRRWCELCDNVWIYGYLYNMLVSGLTPLPEFTKLRRDFPLLKQWGVIGFHDETRNVWAEPGIASKYLRAQLEWDADANVDAILDDFFAKWYGRASGPMKALYFALDQAVASAPIHGHEDRVMPEIYTPELLAELERHLAEARKLALAERTRLHVHVDKLIYDHLLAYKGLSTAAKSGDFAGAAREADRMLALRKQLHAIDPFFIMPDENGYHTGVWYWKITDRRDFYQSLSDKISGKTGELVAMFPQEAAFRTDPHDEGVFAGWHAPEVDQADWRPIDTSRPFYRQGFDDAQGHPYVGNIWYRFTVDVPRAAQAGKVVLYVPLVMTEAWCWVNGEYVGHRPYQEAYIRPGQMEVDVTGALLPGQRNVVAFRVNTSLSPAQAAEGLYSRPFLYTPK